MGLIRSGKDQIPENEEFVIRIRVHRLREICAYTILILYAATVLSFLGILLLDVLGFLPKPLEKHWVEVIGNGLGMQGLVVVALFVIFRWLYPKEPSPS